MFSDESDYIFEQNRIDCNENFNGDGSCVFYYYVFHSKERSGTQKRGRLMMVTLFQ